MRISVYHNTIAFALLLTLLLFITSCKKDKIKITTDRTYIEIRVNVVDGLASGTTMLTLRPDGTAGIAPGGDIVYMGKYTIKGNRLTIKIDEAEQKFRFFIVSDDELRGENGEVLKLEKDE